MSIAINSKDLERIFKGLDQNEDGVLGVDELNWLLNQIGVPCISLEELESLAGKSSLNLDEFMSFYSSITGKNSDKNIDQVSDIDKGDGDKDLLEAFNVFDLNKDGFISSKELEHVLVKLGLWNDNGKGTDAATMIRKYDANFDGLIDLEEFKKMISQ